MVTRADRVGRKKPWAVLAAPSPVNPSEILAELPDDFGLELYSLVRQLRLLADSPAEGRASLFPVKPGRHVAERRTEALHAAAPAVRGPLRMLMGVTSRRPPPRSALGTACEEIALWAQERGHASTAVQFAEAASVIDPSNARLAFVAGRTNRLDGVAWRAETFYTRAIRYAQRKQDWDTYVRANLGLGRLFADRGRLRGAAKHFFTAARVALDQGHDWLAAQTYHDLFPLYFELGDRARAYRYALKTLETYPHHHERYPVAVHDFLLLLILEHHYTEAWPLLRLLTTAPLRSHDQVLIWGTVARTAGSLGHADEYAAAEAKVLELAPHYDSFSAAAHLGLAAGAHGLQDLTLALNYARKGLRIAKSKHDRQALAALDRLTRAVRRREAAPPPALPLEGEAAEALRSISATVESELGAWRADSSWTAKERQSGLWTLGAV